MNYLAHTLLSKTDIDYQLANLLADPLKGRAWTGCRQSHLDGLKMHRLIDAFTDASPHVKRAKNRLGKNGRLKGVIIDIAFDHLLTIHWNQYVRVEFSQFVKDFNHNALERIGSLPAPAASFIERIVSYNVLASYREYSELIRSFELLDKRLSYRILQKESATSYLPALESSFAAIESDFLLFFPELIAEFRLKSQCPTKHHFFKPVIQSTGR